MNWVDLIIVLIFGLYVWDGYRRGFLKLAWELFGLVVAFLFALKFYPPLSDVMINSLNISSLYSKPIAFLGIWFVSQGIFYLIGRLIAFYTPSVFKESKINHYMGLIPAMIKGIIFISVILILFLIIPINVKIKSAINDSFLGGNLIKMVANVENQIAKVFTNDSGESLSSLTNTQQDESSKLNFSTTDITIVPEKELEMLDMLNSERAKVGLKALKENILVRNVARAQSRDMLIRGYFSHNSPTGQGLKERLTSANVNFTAAAENIALAPTIDLAELGLMNSPKHKENILDPTFTEVGIGILDAGPYGLMITQDFIK